MAMMARTNPGPPQLIGRLPVLVLQPGSAQRLDLVGEPAVVAGVVQLDVGEPAVDVAKARADVAGRRAGVRPHTLPEFRSEEHTSELQSLMRISYAVFCLKNKKTNTQTNQYSRLS